MWISNSILFDLLNKYGHSIDCSPRVQFIIYNDSEEKHKLMSILDPSTNEAFKTLSKALSRINSEAFIALMDSVVPDKKYERSLMYAVSLTYEERNTGGHHVDITKLSVVEAEIHKELEGLASAAASIPSALKFQLATHS